MDFTPSIYQLFVGRHSYAQVVAHEGNVFTKLQLEGKWTNLTGFNTIYLLGLWDNRGPLIVTEEEGVLLEGIPQRMPSVFAITDHENVSPVLGSLSQLQELVRHLKNSGFKVIVDLVVNQTSTVHRWVHDHPEFYRPGENGFIAGFSGDVYMLNLERPELLEEFKHIIDVMARLGIDGVRADMAHLAPLAFWGELIQQTKEMHREFMFIAEAYSETLFDWGVQKDLVDCGFDFVYHEFLYRNLRSFSDHNHPLEYVVGHLNYFLNRTDATHYIHYFRNHDDPSGLKNKTHPSGWVQLQTMLPGGTLTYMGSLAGMKKRLAHHHLDLLDDKADELVKIPKWWRSWIAVYNTLKPIAKKFWLEGSLLWAEVSMICGKGSYVVNLEDRPMQLARVDSGSEGLLHAIKGGDELRPGEGELFLSF